jgi:hypothetical protein
MKKLYISLIFLISLSAYSTEFLDYGTIILGRPTDNSITFNLLAKKYLDFYIEYGTSSGKYDFKTANFSSKYPDPVESKINNLNTNQRYYYRIQFRENSNQSYLSSSEYFFQTQRAKGSKFTFTIEADPHLYDKKGSSGLMKINMQNQAQDSADFMLDLGDTFGDDHNPTTITDAQLQQLHVNTLQFFGILCNSSPLFLCLGNHEGESGYYLLQTPPNNLAVYATKWRQKYYPNPIPDGFYTGNDEEEPYGIGKPQNYYAFEWGDALFVIMDVYRYYTANEKPTGWDWTIGKKQYDWFKTTLESSKSKYKFVFAHHTLGQGRGAATTVMLSEWGGWKDTKKSKYEFDIQRPGWGKPIHQLMVDNKVNVFFQGHDHLFAKEIVDGMVYQEVPIPCDSTYEIGMLANADAYTGLNLDGAGYMRVTVSTEEAKVEYIKSYLPKDETDSLKNRMLGNSYSVKSTISDVQIEENNNFVIYPNPADDYIYLSSSEKFIDNIQIFDAMGICIIDNITMSSNFGNFKFDISKLPIGIYFIKIGNKFEKFVKI